MRRGGLKLFMRVVRPALMAPAYMNVLESQRENNNKSYLDENKLMPLSNISLSRCLESYVFIAGASSYYISDCTQYFYPYL